MSERTCIATRTVLPSEDLIRFVLDPHRRVVPDLKGNLPGRGVWVTAKAELLTGAVNKKMFARAFRGEAHADIELVALVGDLMARKALNLLGLATRAGQVTMGFMKLETLVSKGKADILIEACDAAEDGRSKLRNRFLASAEEGSERELRAQRIVGCFNIEQLSLALGRTNVVHAGLINGRLGEDFLAAARRYGSYEL